MAAFIIVRLFTLLAKFGWLLVAGLTCTIAILGSYIFVILQALWWPFLGEADMLLPVKIAIVTGYSALLTYAIIGISRSVRSKDVEAFIVQALGLTLSIHFLYILSSNISPFYAATSFIHISESVLPWEVRVVITFAFVLPIIFLLTATPSLILMLFVRKATEILFKFIASVLQRKAESDRVPTVNSKKNGP